MPPRRPTGLWQVIYIAPSATAGALLKDLLAERGFLVVLRGVGVPAAGAPQPCEVLVPAVEAAEAQEAVTALLPLLRQDEP
jgi:hypothetical protein